VKAGRYRVLLPDGDVLATVDFSPGLWFRMKGLLGRDSLDAADGILLAPCNSIHMFFMRFPIDAVFLDREMRVIRVFDSIAPWRLTPVLRKARAVVEVAAGSASHLTPGTPLCFEQVE